MINHKSILLFIMIYLEAALQNFKYLLIRVDDVYVDEEMIDFRWLADEQADVREYEFVIQAYWFGCKGFHCEAITNSQLNILVGFIFSPRQPNEQIFNLYFKHSLNIIRAQLII